MATQQQPLSDAERKSKDAAIKHLSDLARALLDELSKPEPSHLAGILQESCTNMIDFYAGMGAGE
jgi:hypothetical protein